MRPARQRWDVSGLCALAFLVSAKAAAFGQTSAWSEVRVEQVVPIDLSRKQLQQLLLAEARLKVVQQVAGVRVASVTSSVKAELRGDAKSAQFLNLFLQMGNQDVEGRIVEEESPSFSERDSSGQRILALRLRARVAKDEGGGVDAGYTGTVAVSQPAYRVGDHITIQFTATRPSRAYLFSVQASGSARLIWPNSFDTTNHVPAATLVHVPKRSSNDYSLVAEIDAASTGSTVEFAYVIFSRGDSQLFDPADAFRKEFSLAQINTVLLRIPRRSRAEAWEGYSVAPRQ